MIGTVLTIIYLVLCLVLIASVLLQSGRSAGLGAIAGGAQSLVGKKKGLDEKLGKVTTYVAIAFMLFTIVLVVIN
ncbi:MAG: preprotein translocase subunit SecG [Dethiobacteria bacterium]|nr:preprotein translocase subunit SecG [Bacillota bacterium]MDW7729257.1 preprotein translocase subunit SecG [Bacillota bacterium]